MMVCDPVPVTGTVKLSLGRSGAPTGFAGAFAGFTSVTRSWYEPVAGTSTVTALVIGANLPLKSPPRLPCPGPSLSPSPPKPPKVGGVTVGLVVGVGVAVEVATAGLGAGLVCAKAGDAMMIAPAVTVEAAISAILFFRFIALSFSFGADKY